MMKNYHSQKSFAYRTLLQVIVMFTALTVGGLSSSANISETSNQVQRPSIESESLKVTNEPRLCMKSENPKNYRNGYLQSFSLLRQGELGWLFRDHDLRTSFGPHKSNYKYLRQLLEKLEEKGVNLVMVPIPSRGLVHPEYLGDISYDRESAKASYTLFLQRLRRLGVIVPELELLVDNYSDKPMFFARDHHWNHHGARTIARMTAKSIREQKDYAKIERVKFETSLTRTSHNEGSYSRAADLLCDSDFSSEPYKIYQTSAISTDIFGDSFSEVASISLVGTSNSKGKLRLNFSGFLSHYVKAEVVNLAESGGGYDLAVEKYLTSSDFNNNPPKFLVWEFPAYYSLNDEDFFRELFKSMGDKS